MKDLNQVAQESKEKVENLATPKKGRGRPPKQATQIQETPKPPIDRNNFKFVFNFIGKTTSAYFNDKCFEIDNDENELLSGQAEGVVLEFCPQIANKWVKLTLFIISFASIGGKKYLSFLSRKKPLINNVAKESPNTLKNSEGDSIVKIKKLGD